MRQKEAVTFALQWSRKMHFAALRTTSAPPAFVFDIDGVLIRGKEVLPAAIRAIKKLWQPDGSSPRLPVAFLTNGGGVCESVKAAQLSEWLQVNVDERQVVCSHTPFRMFQPDYSDQPVLVIGRGEVASVAKSYNFQKVVTTLELAKSYPAAVPFWPEAARYATENVPTPKYGTHEAPIRMVKVYCDPSDWYMDLQIITDVLTGHGVMGRRKDEVPPGTPPVDLIFSHEDLVWANEHPVPRFGQGAFGVALRALYRELMGTPLRSKVFGKPYPPPYRLVETILIEQAKELGIELPHPPQNGEQGDVVENAPIPFSAIYAVGDNPAADIRGANAAGHPWVSVLVRTGVWTASPTHDNCIVDPARMVVNDAEAAVDAGLNYARAMRWHSMR